MKAIIPTSAHLPSFCSGRRIGPLIAFVTGMLVPGVASAQSLDVNGVTIEMGGIHYYDQVTVRNGGIIRVTTFDGTDRMNTGNLQIVANHIHIDSTSGISADGRGYQPVFCGNGRGPTVLAGGRGGCAVRDSGGGGGHFGEGGRGTIDNPPGFPQGFEEDCGDLNAAGNGCVAKNCDPRGDALPTVAGQPYSHSIYEIEFGAAGGDRGCLDGDGWSNPCMTAGAGGGRVVLAAVNSTGTGTLLIEGRVSANGWRGCGNGNDSAGGGAGGSVLLVGDSVTTTSTAYIASAGGLGGDTLGTPPDPGDPFGQACIGRDASGSSCTPQVGGTCDDCGGGGGGGIVSVLSGLSASLHPLTDFDVAGAPGGTCTNGNCIGEAGGGAGELQLSGLYVGEICDGFDNDFDGVPDNGFSTETCGTGACEATVDQCTGGQPNVCVPVADPVCQDPITDTRSRFMLIVDTSGSMLLDLNGHFTFGDGSVGHLGLDTNGDGTAGNDSRLFLAKEALTDVISAYFPDIDFGLSRYAQGTQENVSCQLAHWFECAGICCTYDNPLGNTGDEQCQVSAGSAGTLTVRPESPSGEQCINYAGSCGAVRRGADVLVGFERPVGQLLMWMDHTESGFSDDQTPGDYCDYGASGDCELRGTGPTPLADSLLAVRDYLERTVAEDAIGTCRRYGVILLTDGTETCQGEPVAAAAELLADLGIETYVIAFSVLPSEEAALDAIANAGSTSGTRNAIFAGNKDELVTALANIVADSVVFELCNSVDDDCDGEIDEDWPELGSPCDDGLLGACRGTGYYICDLDDPNLASTVCHIDNPGAAPVDEICGDGIDNNCNGLIDEGCCYGPELCNGQDDYCGPATYPYGSGDVYEDGYEDPRIWDLGTRLRLSCGSDEGICVAGEMYCVDGNVVCVGETGPDPEEMCDGLDNNCNGIVNEGIVRRCYTFLDAGCVPDGGQPSGFMCQGTCTPGYQECVVGGGADAWDACLGEVGGSPEICDGVDNNCDGDIDEGLNVQVTCGLGVCERTVWSCPAGVPVQCEPLSEDPLGEWHAGCLNAGDNFCCDTLDQDCDGVVNNGVPPKVCESQTEIAGNRCQGQEFCDEGGNWVNCNAPEPVPEDCNGLDDDCDGRIDNVVNTEDALSQVCYSGEPSQLNLPDAPCQEGLRTCADGEWSVCTGQILPSPEVCDTIDNNCNGEINEGLYRQCFETNEHGICFGQESCDPAGLWVSCDARTPAGELCNGLDDNCNGRIDEGVARTCYPGGQTGCTETPVNSGNWVCQGVCSTGLEACVEVAVEGGGGLWSGTCAGAQLPTEPLAELSCDGLDNDCDGRIDEGISQACFTHASGCSFDGASWTCLGLCRTGSQDCVEGGAGVWTACLNDQGPVQEECDNEDNDCNGLIDDGIPPRACSVTEDVNGVSRTCTGTETCSAGNWVSCTAPTPVVEECDGQDNDCNGLIDDGIAPRACSRSASIGGVEFTCTGVEVCSGGTWVGCNAPTPTAEVCDGQDNNCDGFVDNAVPYQGEPLLSETCYTGDPATLGRGLCAAGTRTCVGGTFGLCENQVLPEVETCDGLDNDCDGHVDNAVSGQAAPLLSQACQNTNTYGTCLGSQECVDGTYLPCNALWASDEVCDGVDNNCDGVIDGVSESCYTFDEGCTGDTLSGFDCEGLCRPGIRTCPVLAAPNPGGNAFGPCQFQVGPAGEICDGLDNNCNGFIDESETDNASPMSRVCYQPGFGPNTGCESAESCKGICRVGIQTCGDPVFGEWSGCVGEVTPEVEICDLLDNDCDGLVDEEIDMPWLGQPCTEDATGLPVCNGIWMCEDGQEICAGGPTEPGRCDGQDNNCNGAIDELEELQEDPEYGESCGVSDVGECQLGVKECIGGGWVCVGNVDPRDEVCDGQDNDCDGLIDNGAPCSPVGSRSTYCVEAECRLECVPGLEFQCPAGYECTEKPWEGTDVYVCMPIVGQCGGVVCPPGWDCIEDECVDPCAEVACQAWEECRRGICVDVSCSGFGQSCPAGDICYDHACVEDPCFESECFSEGAYCVRDCEGAACEGQCEALCDCPGDQICDASRACVEDPCHGVECNLGQRCDPQDGRCQTDPCYGVSCLGAAVCFEGDCIEDPCAMVACPWPYTCKVRVGQDGSPEAGCEKDSSLWVDGTGGEQFLATGGGGCQCNTTGGAGGALTFVLMLMAWLVARRRETRRLGDGGAR